MLGLSELKKLYTTGALILTPTIAEKISLYLQPDNVLRLVNQLPEAEENSSFKKDKRISRTQQSSIKKGLILGQKHMDKGDFDVYDP